MGAGIIERLKPRYDWSAWQSGQIDSLRIQDAWRYDSGVALIAINQRLLDIISSLFGRQAFPFQTLNFAACTQQHAQSDIVHFNTVPERFMCGVWVALEEVDENNGPLLCYPGSHRWPTFLNEHIGVNSRHRLPQGSHYQEYIRLWRELIEVNQVRPERILAKKGQAVIWLANLLHGNDKQHDLTRTRFSQVTHYFFEGCAYYTPLFSDPFYGNISFRDLVDAATCRKVPNTVSGYPVSRRFIEETRITDAPPEKPGELPPGFDPDRYLWLNPDVAAANIDPTRHYVTFGYREGRRWR
jgi:hypothetical protein